MPITLRERHGAHAHYVGLTEMQCEVSLMLWHSSALAVSAFEVSMAVLRCLQRNGFDRVFKPELKVMNRHFDRTLENSCLLLKASGWEVGFGWLATRMRPSFFGQCCASFREMCDWPNPTGRCRGRIDTGCWQNRSCVSHVLPSSLALGAVKARMV